MTDTPFPRFGTDAVHVGQEPEQWGHQQVVPPLSTATTYMQPAPGEPKIYDYGRAGNPTRTCLEKNLAGLEAAKTCYTFSSGLSAVAAVTEMLKAGDHIACCDDVYGGTQRYFRTTVTNHGIETDMVNMRDMDKLKAAIKPNTKMIWIESPTNPMLSVIDIKAVCDYAHSLTPRPVCVVDNTFMTPYFQRPLTLGADIVLHSITKYLNGHSDVVMGCAMTNDEAIGKHLWYQQLAVGACPSPFDCYLVNRGTKTLHVRMRAHGENGLAVAKFLEANPRVEKVLYPGLPSHPHHVIHNKQAKGMSGMVSFYLKGGLDESRAFLKALKVFCLAESLGGYESLAELPSIMTHASVPAAERAVLGITDNLVRLSCGIENGADLCDDLQQALTVAIPKI